MGTIVVTTNRPDAAWSLTGPDSYSGTGLATTITGATDGEYTVTYAEVGAYESPSDETATLSGSVTLEFNGEYQAHTHVRASLREAVATALTAVTAVSHVYVMRSAPYDTLPAFNIRTLDEEVRWDLGSMDSDEQVRELRLSIDIISQTLDDEDDNLDDIVDNVETVLENDSTLQSITWDLLLDTVAFEYSREAGYPFGVAQMIYSLKYVTAGSDPYQLS